MSIAKKTLWPIVGGGLAIWLAVTLLTGRTADSLQTTSSNQTLQLLFAIERKKTYLGEGAAVSPDGTLLVYLGGDSHLYARNLDTNQLHLLLAAAKSSETSATLDVFSDPAFSPDGTRLLVSASGGTYYYPSEIYSMQADGSQLKQLTQAISIPEGQPRPEGAGQALYSQYFGQPQFSPDGTKVLFHIHDVAQGTENVAVMNTDGSHLQVLTPGSPLFWSADGYTIYYLQGSAVQQYSLVSALSHALSGLNGPILGRLPDKEWLVVDGGQSINLMSVQNNTATLVTTWNVPRVKLVGGKQAILSAVQWSTSGRVLLVYQGETMERLEVDQPSS